MVAMSEPYIVLTDEEPPLDLVNFQVSVLATAQHARPAAPAAMVGFFQELTVAESAGDATPQRLDEIAERNQMEVLEPVPETYL
jgi:hypothetical protein